MRRLTITCVAAATLAVAGAVRSLEPETADAPTLDDLAFLAGAWRGEMLGGVGEEFWSPPDAGSMLAAFRLIRGGATVMTEYILVIEDESGVTMRFKHFNNDYTTWEKDAPLTFTLAQAAPNRAVFVSPNAEQRPGHIVYTLEGDSLRVKIGAGRDISENAGAMNLTFTRRR